MNKDAMNIFFLAMKQSLHSLSSWPETELNLDHCNKKAQSLNRWTAREFPEQFCIRLFVNMFLLVGYGLNLG